MNRGRSPYRRDALLRHNDSLINDVCRWRVGLLHFVLRLNVVASTTGAYCVAQFHFLLDNGRHEVMASPNTQKKTTLVSRLIHLFQNLSGIAIFLSRVL